VHQLQQWLDAGKQFQLLDVREMEEWEICHIPQASHIPMRTVMNALPQLQLSPGMPVAVLCHHGMRSKMVAQQLVAAGFEAVYNVEGGIHAWAQEIDEEMMTY